MSNATEPRFGSDPTSTTPDEPFDAPVGLRARKKEQTRERLKQVAFELFSERGFDDVTVDEIAERAEVSKSTLFRYFETKEDLLFADAVGHRDALVRALAGRPLDEPVLVSLRASLHSLAAYYQADRLRAVARNRIMSDSAALAARSLERQAAWEAGLAAVILPRLEGKPDAETRAAVLAAASMAVVRIATRRWVASDDDSQMIDHVLDSLDILIDELDGGHRTGRQPHDSTDRRTG